VSDETIAIKFQFPVFLLISYWQWNIHQEANMARTTTNYVQTVIKHIKERQHLKLFMLLKDISALGKRGREIARKLSLFYPIICRMYHDAGRREDCKELLTADSGSRGIGVIMYELNNDFLLATGCDCCNEKLDLIDPDGGDFIRHIGHRWFREWAYKHIPEKYRVLLLYTMETLRQIEKNKGKRIFTLDDDD